MLSGISVISIILFAYFYSNCNARKVFKIYTTYVIELWFILLSNCTDIRITESTSKCPEGVCVLHQCSVLSVLILLTIFWNFPKFYHKLVSLDENWNVISSIIIFTFKLPHESLDNLKLGS